MSQQIPPTIASAAALLGDHWTNPHRSDRMFSLPQNRPFNPRDGRLFNNSSRPPPSHLDIKQTINLINKIWSSRYQESFTEQLFHEYNIDTTAYHALFGEAVQFFNDQHAAGKVFKWVELQKRFNVDAKKENKAAPALSAPKTGAAVRAREARGYADYCIKWALKAMHDVNNYEVDDDRPKTRYQLLNRSNQVLKNENESLTSELHVTELKIADQDGIIKELNEQLKQADADAARSKELQQEVQKQQQKLQSLQQERVQQTKLVAAVRKELDEKEKELKDAEEAYDAQAKKVQTIHKQRQVAERRINLRNHALRSIAMASFAITQLLQNSLSNVTDSDEEVLQRNNSLIDANTASRLPNTTDVHNHVSNFLQVNQAELRNFLLSAPAPPAILAPASDGNDDDENNMNIEVLSSSAAAGPSRSNNKKRKIDDSSSSSAAAPSSKGDGDDVMKDSLSYYEISLKTKQQKYQKNKNKK